MRRRWTEIVDVQKSEIVRQSRQDEIKFVNKEIVIRNFEMSRHSLEEELNHLDHHSPHKLQGRDHLDHHGALELQDRGHMFGHGAYDFKVVTRLIIMAHMNFKVVEA